MTSINKIILIGGVDAMPVYNLLPSGGKVVKLLLKTQSPDEAPEKHRVLLYGRMGDFALKNLQPDMPVYIEGRIQYRHHVNRNGIKREQTNIIAHRMQLLSKLPVSRNEKPFREGITLENTGKKEVLPGPSESPALLMAPPVQMTLPENADTRSGGKLR